MAEKKTTKALKRNPHKYISREVNTKVNLYAEGNVGCERRFLGILISTH